MCLQDTLFMRHSISYVVVVVVNSIHGASLKCKKKIRRRATFMTCYYVFSDVIASKVWMGEKSIPLMGKNIQFLVEYFWRIRGMMTHLLYVSHEKYIKIVTHEEFTKHWLFAVASVIILFICDLCFHGAIRKQQRLWCIFDIDILQVHFRYQTPNKPPCVC